MKLVLLLAAVLAGGVVLGAGALLVLATVLVNTGSASSPGNGCRSPGAGAQARPVEVSPEESESFEQKWDELVSRVASGETGFTVTFSESEVTSRARDYLAEKSAPVSDVLICFHDGDAEGRAHTDFRRLTDVPVIGGLFDTNVKVRGAVDLTQNSPQIQIEKLDAGNLPGFVTDEIGARVEDAVNTRLNDVRLHDRYSVTFREGEVAVGVAQ